MSIEDMTIEEILEQTTEEDVALSREVCHDWNMVGSVSRECFEDDENDDEEVELWVEYQKVLNQ